MGGKSGKSRNSQMKKLIAANLKKASRRSKKKILVARVNVPKSHKIRRNIQVAKVLNLPKRGPMPVFRAQIDDPLRLRIEQAHIASVAYAPNETTLSRDSIDAIRNKLLAMNTKLAPVPQRSPIAQTDSVTTATIKSQKTVALASAQAVKQKTSKNIRQPAAKTKNAASRQKRPSGWHVQIGAVPTQKLARSLLSKMRGKMPILADGNMFGDLDDYLEPVTKNGQTLYRARFVGFINKSSARSACKAMKKRKFSCLALKG